MDAPTIEDNLDAGITLEAVELELALQLEDQVQSGFENSIRHALDTTGGQLLFHMRADDGMSWVAAVAVGNGTDRQVLMVTIPNDGEMRIEPSDQSRSPLARIAPAFADVMEKLVA